MNKLTILNITDSNKKFVFVEAFTMTVVTGAAFCMIIWYRQKYESYKTKIDPMLHDFDDIAIARYSIFFRHIPTNIGVEEMQRAISIKMNKLYPVNPNTGKSPFVKARVIGDYASLYRKCIKLKQAIDKLDVVKRQNR